MVEVRIRKLPQSTHGIEGRRGGYGKYMGGTKEESQRSGKERGKGSKRLKDGR